MLQQEEVTTHLCDSYLFDDYALQVNTALGDPTGFEEAARHQEWREAMKAEIEAIERNQT